MKKIIKLVTIIIIFVIAFILINYIRNLVISNKLIKAGSSIFNSSNYHITVKSTNTDYTSINEIYYKDNICLINTYNNDNLTEIYWKNYSTEECITHYPDSSYTTNEFNEELINSIKYDIMLENNSFSIFAFVVNQDNCYIIKDKNRNNYFDKETGLLVKKEYYFEENYNILNNISEFKYEQNTVTDEQVKKPEV